MTQPQGAPPRVNTASTTASIAAHTQNPCLEQQSQNTDASLAAHMEVAHVNSQESLQAVAASGTDDDMGSLPSEEEEDEQGEEQGNAVPVAAPTSTLFKVPLPPPSNSKTLRFRTTWTRSSPRLSCARTRR